jgi:hypothetical protein
MEAPTALARTRDGWARRSSRYRNRGRVGDFRLLVLASVGFEQFGESGFEQVLAEGKQS